MSPSADFLGTAEPIFKYGYEATFDQLSDEVLKFSQSITLPKSGSSVVEVFYKNYKKTIAGASIHEKCELKIKAFVSPNTASKCWKWYRKVYPSTGKVGNPKDYKTNGYVKLLDGQGSQIASWMYEGCWPSSIEMGDASQGDNPTIIEIGLSLEYDNVTGLE